jgi:hypothetical protein
MSESIKESNDILQKRMAYINNTINHQNGSSLDEFELSDARLSEEELLKPLQSRPDPLVLRKVIHECDNAVVNGNVYIAVPHSDPTGTAAEELDGDGIVLEEKLYPLKGDDSSIVELVGLLRYFVCYLLQFLI